MTRVIVLASIGVVSTTLMFVTHELGGHGLATVLLGARLTHMTSVDSSYDGNVALPAMRLIAAAGIVANVVGGIVALALRAQLSRRAALARFFLWFFGHATLFMGTSYLAGFAFLPFGDVHGIIAGLPHERVLSGVLLIAGALGYWTALRHAERTNDAPLGDVTVAYLAAGAIAVVSGAFNPAGPADGVAWSAAATFGAGYGSIAAAAASGARAAAQTADHTSRVVWPSLGALAALALVVVLGPGVPR